MSALKSAMVTKYDAGGSGDNLIPDGYIKSIEKVWLDSFTFSTVLTTADSLVIAYIPKNKKITGVEVYLPATFAPSTSTINVGLTGNMSLFVTSSTAYIVGNLAATGSTLLVTNKVTMNNPLGMGFVITAEKTPIYLSIGVTAVTAPTAGTITTLVRYT